MKKLIFLLLLAAPALLHAQTNLGRTKSRRRQEKRADPMLAHLQALENAVAAQQQQIQQLTNELKQRDEQWVQFQQEFIQAKETANRAQAQAVSADAYSSQASTAVVALKTDVSKLQSTVAQAAPPAWRVIAPAFACALASKAS